jgi:hypothetical protein
MASKHKRLYQLKDPKMDAGMISNQTNSKIKSFQQAIDVRFLWRGTLFALVKKRKNFQKTKLN